MTKQTSLKPLLLMALLALFGVASLAGRAAPAKLWSGSTIALCLGVAVIVLLLVCGLLAGLRGKGPAPELEALTLPPETGPAPLSGLASARAEHEALIAQVHSLQQELARETERLRGRRDSPA